MNDELSHQTQMMIMDKFIGDIETKSHIFGQVFTTDSQRQVLMLCYRLEKLKSIPTQDGEARRDNLGQLHHESVKFAQTVAKLDEAGLFVETVSKSLVQRYNQTQVKAAMKIISDEVKSVTEQNETASQKLEFK